MPLFVSEAPYVPTSQVLFVPVQAEASEVLPPIGPNVPIGQATHLLIGEVVSLYQPAGHPASGQQILFVASNEYPLPQSVEVRGHIAEGSSSEAVQQHNRIRLLVVASHAELDAEFVKQISVPLLKCGAYGLLVPLTWLQLNPAAALPPYPFNAPFANSKCASSLTAFWRVASHVFFAPQAAAQVLPSAAVGEDFFHPDHSFVEASVATQYFESAGVASPPAGQSGHASASDERPVPTAAYLPIWQVPVQADASDVWPLLNPNLPAGHPTHTGPGLAEGLFQYPAAQTHEDAAVNPAGLEESTVPHLTHVSPECVDRPLHQPAAHPSLGQQIPLVVSNQYPLPQSEAMSGHILAGSSPPAVQQHNRWPAPIALHIEVDIELKWHIPPHFPTLKFGAFALLVSTYPVHATPTVFPPYVSIAPFATMYEDVLFTAFCRAIWHVVLFPHAVAQD